MSLLVIELGEVEPIKVYVIDRAGNALPGKTDIHIRINRDSDGWFLDWDDNTFKSSGHTTLNTLLAEVDATNAAGLYELSGGFDSGAITNLAATENLNIITLQTPGIDALVPGPTELQIRPGAAVTASSVATAVWDIPTSAHTVAGTTGDVLQGIKDRIG